MCIWLLLEVLRVLDGDMEERAKMGNRDEDFQPPLDLKFPETVISTVILLYTS